ncbi:MAG: formylglycine-generating enzyme family protein [Hyphomicrobiaceae bacterium]
MEQMLWPFNGAALGDRLQHRAVVVMPFAGIRHGHVPKSWARLRSFLTLLGLVVLVTLAMRYPVLAQSSKSTCVSVAVDVRLSGKTCLNPSDPARREFRDCFHVDGKRRCGPVMVVLPKGRFLMGSPRSELGHSPEETGPNHQPLPVDISMHFAVGKFEVTFDDWQACVACRHQPDDAGWGRGSRPVIDVSWDDAIAYVKWLSQATGKRYRLLSEAEWEYAARGGTRGPFSTGATITAEQANFNARLTYGGSGQGTYRRQTVAVGSFPPNAFGLYDMHGNVWEWVDDCWSAKLTGRIGAAPTDKIKCYARSFRGGTWLFDPRYLRSASRNRYPPDYRYNTGGFRVALTLKPS